MTGCIGILYSDSEFMDLTPSLILVPPVLCTVVLSRVQHSLYMIGATGSVRGKKEFEPNSLAPESEPLLGPHLEDYWSIEDYWARSGGLLG